MRVRGLSKDSGDKDGACEGIVQKDEMGSMFQRWTALNLSE